MNPQSNLYWAMRVGFAEAHSDNFTRRPVSREEIADLIDEVKAITSSTAVRVLRTEHLIEQVRDRLPPGDEFHYRLLEERLPDILTILPFQAVEHLVDALRHKFAREWDECVLCLCRAVESMFYDVFCTRILEHPEFRELHLVVPRTRNAPRTYAPSDWNRIQISAWAVILRTTTKQGRNAGLREALSRTFPDADLDSVVKLNVEVAQIGKLRGSASHHSHTPGEQRTKNAGELWDLVVARDGRGFLANFLYALGLGQSQ